MGEEDEQKTEHKAGEQKATQTQKWEGGQWPEMTRAEQVTRVQEQRVRRETKWDEGTKSLDEQAEAEVNSERWTEKTRA